MFISQEGMNLSNIETLLCNLCKPAKEELTVIYGKDYVMPVVEAIYKADKKYFIRLKKTGEIVGTFGLIYERENVRGIFLLMSDDFKKGNMTTFLRGAKKQIAAWNKEYKLLLDSCYKKNATIKKWLKLLGFLPSEYQDENFQVYYSGDITLYD